MVYSEGIIVVHSIQGRMRVRVVSIRSSQERAAILEQWLTQQAEVQKVEVRAITGSVILFYNPSKNQPDAILKLLVKGLKNHRRASDNHPIQQANCCQGAQVSSQTSFWGSMTGRVVGLIALTGFLTYALVRKFILKSPLSESPFSPLGVVATVGAVPLLRKAFSNLPSQKRLSLFPFLAGAALLAVLIGQALTALEVVWVTFLSMLLEEYAADRSRRAIRETLQVAAYKAITGEEKSYGVRRVPDSSFYSWAYSLEDAPNQGQHASG